MGSSGVTPLSGKPIGIQLRSVCKSFNGAPALTNVDLSFESGEFVGLMGPNGAGKSTLVKVLDGLYDCDSGQILVNGQAVTSLAGRTDVAFIHQEAGLIDGLSIVDNLRLAQPPLRVIGPLLDHRRERVAAREALEHVDLPRSVDTLVGELEPGEKTLVAVARAFARGAMAIFVDEATSTLPPADAAMVISSLRRSASSGALVVMVTHKLAEILETSNRVVVLVDGEIAEDRATRELDRHALVKMLVSHESEFDQHSGGSEPRAAGGADADEVGEIVMRLDEASGGRAGPIDLTLRRGEVVGITGLLGSGLHELAFLVYGALPLSGGHIESTSGSRTALVPPYRETEGGFDAESVADNLTLTSIRRWRSRIRLIRRKQELAAARDIAVRLDVRPRSISTPYGVLSGGNKQKVLFGRAMLHSPDLYVLCEPTRGVDIAARLAIYDVIRSLKQENVAALVVSSDAEDILAICDRASVIENGRVTEPVLLSDMNVREMEVLV